MKFRKCSCDCNTCTHEPSACLKFATERVEFLGVLDDLCKSCFDRHQKRANGFSIRTFGPAAAWDARREMRS
jgi:hypothetical protein